MSAYTWHLITPSQRIARSCLAERIEQAQFRLAPIPRGWFVASDVSYRMGYRIVPKSAPLCLPKNHARGPQHPQLEMWQ